MAIELDDGRIIRSLPEQVTKNKEDVEDLQNDLTALEQQVASALAGVFHYKGSVATYGDLPSSGNEVGDVWNVLADGKNYAWSGSGWDDLGGIVDLSNYVTLDGSQIITGYKTFNSMIDAMNGIAMGQGGEINDLQGGIRFKDYNGVGLDYEDAALKPAITSTIDLGSPINAFKDIYLTGKIQFATNYRIDYLTYSTLALISGNNIIATNNICPSSSATYDIGQSNLKWKDGYFSGKVYTIDIDPQAANVYIGTYGYYMVVRASSLMGGSDGTRNLGTGSVRWNNVYLKGVLSDGANTASVADIVAQKEATGGTLRQLLAIRDSIQFLTTEFIDGGSLNWSYNSTNSVFYAEFPNKKADYTNQNIICTKYQTTTESLANMSDLTIKETSLDTQKDVAIKDSSFSGDTTAFKNAMKGVLIAYKKA